MSESDQGSSTELDNKGVKKIRKGNFNEYSVHKNLIIIDYYSLSGSQINGLMQAHGKIWNMTHLISLTSISLKTEGIVVYFELFSKI